MASSKHLSDAPAKTSPSRWPFRRAGRSLATVGPSSRFWRRFRRHRLAVGASVTLLALAAAAFLGPFVIGHNPNAIDLGSINTPQGSRHWLGTDRIGRDVLARLIYGAQVSLSVGVVAVTIYTTLGIVLGALAGYYQGVVDHVIMRVTDIVMSFPGLLIIITVVALVGPSIYNVMLVIGLLGWPGICRLVRAQFLSLRRKEFVEAAICLGVPDATVIVRHLLPNVMAPVIVAATFGAATTILTEAGLSFLGLGVQPPTPSWGNMLNEAQNLTYLEGSPWLWVPPGLAIAIAVLAINFLGDGLRDAFDPRMTID